MASKIVLKSTTKLSLNERFSAYRKNVGPVAGVGSTANIRQRIQQIHQATAKNRRLAIQMENRPSVIAALKLKKKSLKQRLGNINVQQFRAQRGIGNRPRGINRLRGVLSRRGGNRDGSVIRRGFGLRRDNFPNTSNVYRRGLGSGGGRRGMRRGRGLGNGRGRGGSPSGMVQFRTISGQRSRGGFRGRGRGGRGGRGGQNVPTKQQLDNEIEQYMANSKTQLDSELDAYMADAS